MALDKDYIQTRVILGTTDQKLNGSMLGLHCIYLTYM